jgi:glycosyltransferase involved in cell wall biosynthesis
MESENLRLGVVAGRTAHFGDEIWTAAGLGRLIDVWSKHFRRVTVALSGAPERITYHDMRLDLPREDCLPLPFLPSVGRGFHKVLSCRRVIREVERRSDVVLVQLPFAATLALLRPKRPRVYHICADIAGMARASNVYAGIRRVPAVLAGSTFDLVQNHLLHLPSARVVTNGEELWNLYNRPPGRAVVSTTILDREVLSVPRQRPPDAPFRILFVGYLRRAKGVDTLLEAYDQVLDQIPNAELVIVGPKSIVDQGMTGSLERELARFEQKGTVRCVGHVNFGPELFQQYADADVLALPSRSEGTPRVLVEARAFGCPVISTRIGGIPTSVTHEHDGLLIEPDDPAALRDAILRVARDRELREKLVRHGLERARASTVESFARAIIEELALVAETQAVKG